MKILYILLLILKYYPLLEVRGILSKTDTVEFKLIENQLPFLSILFEACSAIFT